MPVSRNDGGAATSASSLQRGSDQVAHPCSREDFLGGKEPVIAGQVHPAAQRYGLAKQSHADLPGCRGWYRTSKEQPGVGTLTRP